MAAHHAARPAPGEWRTPKASRVCIAPPAVNSSEPAKNVAASAPGPTSSTYPGNGPIRKHSDPAANSSDIQRSRLIAVDPHAEHVMHGRPAASPGDQMRAPGPLHHPDRRMLADP